jgi:plastocyanin
MPPPCPPRRSSPSRTALLLALAAWAPGAAAAGTHVVELGNFVIEPAELTIQAGDTVEWRIRSGRHSATAKDQAWDSGELEESLTFTHRFDAPGVYPYFCTPHDFMRGTITVLEPPSWWQRAKAWLAALW